SEEKERSPFEDHEERHGSYKEVDLGRVPYGVKDEEIDEEPQNPEDERGEHEGKPVVRRVGHYHIKAQVCGDHVEVPLGKVGNVQNTEYNRETRCQEHVDAPLGDPVQQV